MDRPRKRGPGLRRRTFLALGPAGVAAGALAGCGTEVYEPSEERDVQLLSEALVGEENAGGALSVASFAAGAEASLLKELRDQASANAATLQKELDALGATAEGEFSVEGSKGREEVLKSAIEATDTAVAAYRLGAGELSTPALRRIAIELITADGARLALLNGMLGEDETPSAFVTGGKARPIESAEEES